MYCNVPYIYVKCNHWGKLGDQYTEAFCMMLINSYKSVIIYK